MAARIITVAKVEDLISLYREVGYTVPLFWDSGAGSGPSSVVWLSAQAASDVILRASMIRHNFDRWRATNPEGVNLIEGRVEFVNS
jgi:hypothetical protein